MRALPLVAIAGLLAACGDDGGTRRPGDIDAARPPDAPPDACVPSASLFTLTQPAEFACHDPFKFTVTIANNSCDQLEVNSGVLHAEVLTGNCVPAGDVTIGGTGVPVASIPRKTSLQAYDFTGNPFCCTAPSCPSTFDCDERFTLTLQTNQGPQVFTNDSHVSLGNCDEVCP